MPRKLVQSLVTVSLVLVVMIVTEVGMAAAGSGPERVKQSSLLSAGAALVVELSSSMR